MISKLYLQIYPSPHNKGGVSHTHNGGCDGHHDARSRAQWLPSLDCQSEAFGVLLYFIPGCYNDKLKVLVIKIFLLLEVKRSLKSVSQSFGGFQFHIDFYLCCRDFCPVVIILVLKSTYCTYIKFVYPFLRQRNISIDIRSHSAFEYFTMQISKSI